jgi:pimeloyl-ACP methyl ester carboxylesterase
MSWTVRRQRRSLGIAMIGLSVALVLIGCGGGDGDDAADRPAAPETTAASSSPRQVTARLPGRTLSGHCSGKQGGMPPVVLESGMAVDADQNQLASVEQPLAKRTLVCAYDRAGVGESDPPPKTPRRLDDVAADLNAFIAAAKVTTPYVLVGFSAGGAIVFRQAQAHPGAVGGFVSMNPVPPATTFLREARKVETKQEYQDALAFFERAENEESIVFAGTERILRDPLPPTMPYAVLFDEDCGGDTGFCQRILPPLTRATKRLSEVGEGGRFVAAKGAGHNIFETQPKLVLDTVGEILEASKAR